MYKSKYNLKDKVTIDGQDIIGTIIEVRFCNDGEKVYVLYGVEWLHNGTNQSAYITGIRLSLIAAS